MSRVTLFTPTPPRGPHDFERIRAAQEDLAQTAAVEVSLAGSNRRVTVWRLHDAVHLWFLGFPCGTDATVGADAHRPDASQVVAA